MIPIDPIKTVNIPKKRDKSDQIIKKGKKFIKTRENKIKKYIIFGTKETTNSTPVEQEL